MSSQIQTTDPLLPAERRNLPRLACAFPVLLRSRKELQNNIEHCATISNLSANGVYLHTHRFVTRGQTLFIFMRFSNQPDNERTAPRLAASAKVVRVEPRPDGSYGVALRIQRYRLL